MKMVGFCEHIKEIVFKGFTELYITIPRGDVHAHSLEACLVYLDGRSARIVQANFFGNIESAEPCRKIMGDVPVFVLGDALPDCGLLVRAIIFDSPNGSAVSLSYITKGDAVVGCRITTDSVDLLSGVSHGCVIGDHFSSGVLEEYGDVDRLVTEQGFQFGDVYRLWNYMDDILSHYGEFNEARDSYFDAHAITNYPAATGIGAHLADNKAVAVNFEAAKGDSVIVGEISSDLQCEAFEYGPKFSRAVSVHFIGSDVKKVYVSGTSTIGKQGESVISSLTEENIAYTLRSIDDLLRKEGMGFEHIVSATVYGVNEEVLDAFRLYYEANKMNFPFLAVENVICRKELPFEVECIAVNRCS